MLSNLQSLIKHSNFGTPVIQKKLVAAHRYLGELKGACTSIPNQNILISTLSLQESEQSSAIENIFSTQDALYKSRLNPTHADANAKEVLHHDKALYKGYELVKANKLIKLNTILEVQKTLLKNNAGVRTTPGTVIVNTVKNQIIYRPPEPQELAPLLNDLEIFINEASVCQLDPLIKMALIHHQFESIHPFYDGNGRTGRIINILYLVKENLLETPILYLSRYINQTKPTYYRLLQSAREQEQWHDWVNYMLDGVHLTAQNTLLLIQDIKKLLQETKEAVRTQCPKIYSQDLLNNLFTNPYTKIPFLVKDLNISNNTAARYLDTLVQVGLLTKEKLGRENYYLNTKLIDLLFNIPPMNFESLRGSDE